MRNIKFHPYFETKLPPMRDIVNEMPKGKSYPWPARSLERIDTIVIHHFASEASLINNANYHINGRGWRGLGYHIVIDNGESKQTNDLSHITNHCSGYNERGIGVSVRGDLSKRPLTELERNLLYATIITLKTLFPKAVVKGHNELTPTTCPCTSMIKIREDVFALEQEIEQMNSPKKKEELAYRMANQVLYLQRMSQGTKSDGTAATDGQKVWALNELLKLEPEFRRLGFLK